jgi:hypothetical protein
MLGPDSPRIESIFQHDSPANEGREVSIGDDGMSNKGRWICLAALLTMGVTGSSTTLLGWTQDGIEWLAHPVGSSAGDCFGNCGAGCSDTWNICGGPTQYWDLDLHCRAGRLSDGCGLRMLGRLLLGAAMD